jgi:adenine-specific DNA-methyltransferase
MTEFLQSSLDFSANTSLEYRKARGQYMTPRTISSILLDRLPIKEGDTILDPAAGTGELLYAAAERIPNATYEGWDIDESILEYTTNTFNITFKQKDCLAFDAKEKYDVIIANPPYFEMKLDASQKAKFASIIGGRPNIFSLFFYQAVRLLKEGGHLGFVVPPSMNNGAFFKNLRKFLLNNCELIDLHIINKSDHFIDAQTSAQIIVFKKTTTPVLSKEFIFISTDKSTGKENVIFTQNTDYLTQAWSGKKSLWDLGYNVTTGSVAWNQHKDNFVGENDGIPLIYAKDIKANGIITYHTPLNDRRYLPAGTSEAVTGGGIVVNRITGAVGSGVLRAALKDDGPFFGENHVNVVTARKNFTPEIDLNELLVRIRKVDPAYLALLTGNTQISARELGHHIPF